MIRISSNRSDRRAGRGDSAGNLEPVTPTGSGIPQVGHDPPIGSCRKQNELIPETRHDRDSGIGPTYESPDHKPGLPTGTLVPPATVNPVVSAYDKEIEM